MVERGFFTNVAGTDEHEMSYALKPEIKEASYEKPDLDQIADEQVHLTKNQNETFR